MLDGILQRIYDWSEVWALLIPLGVLRSRPKQPAAVRSVVLYLWIALFLNLVCDIIGDFRTSFPLWMQSNTPLYNIHSVVRFACFAAFFMALRQPFFNRARTMLAGISLLFLVVNFGFNEKFFNTDYLSGNLLSFEAYLLLVYCLLYYLSQLKSDTEVIASGPDFWVATGLCVYVVVNFFLFLFYVPMIKQDEKQHTDYANQIWNVHNFAYILFCVFIAKAFYVSPRLEHRT